jgi:hypothetical protein
MNCVMLPFPFGVTLPKCASTVSADKRNWTDKLEPKGMKSGFNGLKYVKAY